MAPIRCSTGRTKHNKKKAPPDQTPIKPNKGSALPSKGKQRKEQAPIKSRRQKDKNLILKRRPVMKTIKEGRYILSPEDPIKSKVLKSKISAKKKSTKDKPYP